MADALRLLAASALVLAALELGHFRWLRRLCARLPVLRSLIECHFCSGFWAGVAVYLATGPREPLWDALRAVLLRGLAGAWAAALLVPAALLARQAWLERVEPHD